ncbi:MAG: metallophosphoesterase [Endomicrobia bacterium]|nr:metallophosphoesterase [Endomicrobiia bacterium]MCL2506793.1 metallophosphoesterase [Endomicrobiia bacterium]
MQNKKWLYVLFAAGFVSAFVIMPLITRFDNILVSLYYNLVSAWLGGLLYLTCFMVVFEITNLIYKMPAVKSAITIIITAIVVSVFSLFNAVSLQTANVTIPVRNLEHEVRIVQISDIHLGPARGKNYLEIIVRRTNELQPDFVVITGDIADGKSALTKNMFTPLKDLQAPAYFVYGNHDVYIGLDKLIKQLEENNVKVMQNEVLVTKGIKLIGLNYMKADDSVYDPHQVTDETIKDTLPLLDLSGEFPKIVLHHGPWGVEYMNEHGVDLVLAGHTHGGQIFPASLIAKLAFPYTKGLTDYKGTYIYISQGAGTFLPRMRLGTKNEINLITLEPVK